jgi:hypothetical protein
MAKKKVLMESMRHGIEYRCLNFELLSFLILVKQSNVQGYPVQRVYSDHGDLELVPLDTFFDYLFAECQIKASREMMEPF